VLLPRMNSYRLSATHLNAFLDVCDGGPQTFLVNYLLHFPQADNVHMAYGSAIHQTLQQAHTDFIAIGQLRPIEDIVKDFEINLQRSRLEPHDFESYVQKGTDELSAYLTHRAGSFAINQKVELDFAGQEAMLGEAKLTGKLDLVTLNNEEKTMVVSDYKTGKPATSWQSNEAYEKIKLHKYRQQLLFYKLLVEHSRDFGNYTVKSGSLEFIEPTRSGETIVLDLQPTREELDHVSQLISAVWRRIQTLDLPDTSQYSKDLKGIEAFEQDLIDNTL
jgi:DNA helicase II / ATP-dependent DNA helicase PcrA